MSKLSPINKLRQGTKLTTPIAITPDDRVVAIDALRGFALAGIVVAHMVEQFLATMPTPELAATFWAGTFDKVVQGLVVTLVTGKFFALFSFLFGLSFFLQMDRAANKEIDFRSRFLWRLTILCAIGYAHSLFYRGDILTIYAPLGFLLVLFYNVRSTAVLTIAGLLIAGIGRYVVFALYGDGSILSTDVVALGEAQSERYFAALQHGSLADVFAANAIYGHLDKLEFQLGYLGRLYLTFAYFLLGIVAGRAGLFMRVSELHANIKKALWIAIAVALVSLVAAAFLFGHTAGDSGSPQFDRWPSMFALTAFDFFNSSLALVYVCGFLMIFVRPAGSRLLGLLAPYGRTALTNYVLQTLIGTCILYNWGLGLLGDISSTTALLIAFGIIAFQVALSHWWLTRYRFGPLEWLWRSATYLRWQPMVKA